MAPESNALSVAVTVCGNRSLLIQTMRSPRCTVKCAGLYWTFSIVTVCVVACDGPASPGTPAESAAASAAPASGGTMDNNISAARLTDFIALTAALSELSLHVLGVVQMLDECGAHLDQQRLQLRVLCA